MPLTRDFRMTVMARAERDPAFRSAMLTEAMELLLAGDLPTGKIILRDYINATVGFQELGAAVGIPAKSLMRMFSEEGNPRADNLFAVIGYLQDVTGVHLKVRAA